MAPKAARKAAAATNKENVAQLRKNIIQEIVAEFGESVDPVVAQEFQKIWVEELAAFLALVPALLVPQPAPPSAGTTSRAAASASPAHHAFPAEEMVDVFISVKTGGHLTILAPDPPSAGTTSWPVASTNGTAKSPPIKIVPVKSRPIQPEAGEKRVPVSIPRFCLQDGAAAEKLGTVLHSPAVIKSVLAHPVEIIKAMMQNHIITAFNDDMKHKEIQQVDGADDDSTDESSDEEEYEEEEEENEEEEEEEQPDKKRKMDEEQVELKSEDDTDEDSSSVFQTENVLICQLTKAVRKGNKWEYTFVDGLLNVNGRDVVFREAKGTAVWRENDFVELTPNHPESMKIYRLTKLGETLIVVVDKFIQADRISREQGDEILQNFDDAMFGGFQNYGVKNEVKFKARYLDGFLRGEKEWMVRLSQVDFSTVKEEPNVPLVSAEKVNVFATLLVEEEK